MPRDKPVAPDLSYVDVLTMQEGTKCGWPAHEWPILRQLTALLEIDIRLAPSGPGSMSKKDWAISKIDKLRRYKVAREEFPSLEVGGSVPMESAVGASTDPTQPRKSQGLLVNNHMTLSPENLRKLALCKHRLPTYRQGS
jgi:hypothetical protein